MLLGGGRACGWLPGLRTRLPMGEGGRHLARPKPWGPPPGPAPQPGGLHTLTSAPRAPAQPAPRQPSPGGGQGPALVLTPTRQLGEAPAQPSTLRTTARPAWAQRHLPCRSVASASTTVPPRWPQAAGKLRPSAWTRVLRRSVVPDSVHGTLRGWVITAASRGLSDPGLLRPLH